MTIPDSVQIYYEGAHPVEAERFSVYQWDQHQDAAYLLGRFPSRAAAEAFARDWAARNDCEVGE